MSSMGKLLTVETKLFLREPPARLLGVVVPALLLAALGGLFPGFTEPVKEFGGLRLIDVYLPISLVVALATVGVTGSHPSWPRIGSTGSCAGRDARRSFPAPVDPAARAPRGGDRRHRACRGCRGDRLRRPVPEDLVMFGLVLLLAAAAMFSIGLLIGALAPTVSSGQGIAMAVYFPMLLFAGVYFLARRCRTGSGP